MTIKDDDKDEHFTVIVDMENLAAEEKPLINKLKKHKNLSKMKVEFKVPDYSKK